MVRPFRFGCQSYTASSAKEWKDKARQAEDLGYSCFSVADHYIGPGPALEATRHPLQDIAAVLRHRSIHTTEIYAKVDVRMLQAIAQPWPEVRPC